MASSSTNPYEGGGGIGGKIRRRTARPAASPYARPPEAARAPEGGALAAAGSGGWISKLVDPASRFIAGSASRLLSSVFKKGPPALENAPVLNSSAPENTIHEVEEEGEEQLPPLITPVKQSREVPAQIVSDATMNNEQTENGGPKMDERLPQKDERGARREDKRPMDSIPTNNVINISEIELLLAQKTFTKEQFDRLTDLLRARTVEPNLPKFAPANKEKHEPSLIPPFRQNLAESSKKQVMFSTPASTILIPKEEAATSPMELAKAYMNSKSFNKGSSPSSALRLRTPIFTERKPSPFLADVTHVSAKSSGSGLALAPPRPAFSPVFDRSRDGFATPRSLGRTAISRMCRSPFVKGPGSSGSAYTNKFSPYDTPTGSTSGGKQVLKRGSAALYEEIGTVGPIRRIRQKLNMNGPPKEPAPSPYRNFTRTNPKTLMNTNQASTSAAQKRLENNDGYDESDMRDEMEYEEMKNGALRFNQVQARSSEMASKILDVVGKITKTPSPKRDVMQIEGPGLEKEEREKVDKSEGKLSLKNNGVDMFGSSANAKGKAALDPPAPKITKPSFRMSVPEDLLDDDDEDENTNTESETTVPVKNLFNKVESSTSGKSNLELKPVQEPVPNLDEKVKPVPPAVISSPTTEPETKKTALAPPASEPFKFSSDTKFQMPSMSSPVESESRKDENTPPKAAAPLFGFGVKKEEKSEAAASPFSWATPNAQAKADTGISKPAAADASDSERSSQKRKSEAPPKLPETSFAPPQSSPPIFSFGEPSSPAPSLSNGSHSPPKFSFSSSPAVAPSSEPVVTTPATDVAKLPVNPFASGPGFSTATGSKDFSSPAPKVPSFQFGSSASAGTQTEQVTADSDAKVTETSPVKPFAFGTGTGTASTAGTGSSSAGTGSATAGTATFGLFSSTPVTFGSATGTGTGTGTVTGAGTTGTGSATFQFGNSGSSTSTFGFGASSQPASTSSTQATFNFSATNPSSNSSSSLFNFGSSIQNPSSSPSIASSTGSQPSFAFGASKPAQSEAQPTQPAQSQSSGSQLSTTLGNTSTGFSFTSSAMSSGSSQSGLFGSGFGPAPSTTPVFGTDTSGTGTSTSTSTSTTGTSFNFGQSSSAQGSSFAFGAQPNSSLTFAFGATNPNPASVFGLSKPNSGTGFGLSNPNSGTGASMGFGLSNPNPGTGFGLSNPNPGRGFGLANPNTGTNNDQMSMEDSMVDAQAAKIPPVPPFGQLASPFGQPASQPTSSFGQPASPFSQQPAGFTFGATTNQAAPPGFQPPGGNLEFSAGPATFSQGSNAGERGNRRIVKAGRKNRVRK